MKKNIGIISLVLFSLAACDTEGVKKEPKKDQIKELKKPKEQEAEMLEKPGKLLDEKELAQGLKIKWYKHGEGEDLSYGDMVAVDYKVLLTNGEIIDGNHLLKKESLPFMIGFGMQTRGWDLALEEMKVGDHVEIFIPSKLARGEQAVEGLFPANSDNILKIRVLKKMKPDRQRDGNKVWIFEENPQNKTKFNEKNTVKFHCMAFTPSNPIFVNTWRTNAPITMKLEDNGIVPGLKKALINAKKADRMWVYVPSAEAYKNKGYQDLVKPNEDLLYNVFVLDVRQ